MNEHKEDECLLCVLWRRRLERKEVEQKEQDLELAGQAIAVLFVDHP